jgi:hypothetical protein
MDSVRNSARRIRRRRRIASGAASVAVLAIVVPTGIVVTHNMNGSQGGGVVAAPSPSVHASPRATDSASPSPSPTTSVSPPAATKTSLPPGTVALTTADIPRGDDPNIVYLDGKTVHTPDGRTENLPAAYTSITPLHGGWLANAFAQGEYSVVQLDNNDRVFSAKPGGDGFALSDDGTEVSWFEAGDRGRAGHLISALASGMSDMQPSFETPAGAQVRPVGFIGSGSVVYQVDDTSPQVRVTDFGNTSSTVPGALAAGGASEATGRIAVQTRSVGSGSCWAVVDVHGNADWRTCDYSLGRFSPDGRYVIGTDAYADGLGDSWVAVLDAKTGHEVARYQRADNGSASINDLAWEDSTHLLATVRESGRWSILRMSTDGRLESASDQVPGDETSPPFEFAATP